ncbi:Glutamate receptor-like 67, partial [Homarus americanus]
LRQVSWCVTVVVVSDDPAFLAAFAEWSLKGRLLVWPTRLLVVTRLPLPELHYLHKLLSTTNSMLLVVQDTSGKFRFLRRPTLAVATEALHSREVTKKDKDGKNTDTMVDYLAQGLNFTYKYVQPADGTFGSKQNDGSWSGMVGMVARGEADIALGPFGITESRTEVVDFTWPVMIQYSRIMGSRGLPEVDPWGFLLPLTPQVWTAILAVLLLLPVVIFLLSSFFSFKAVNQHTWTKAIFDLIRILLQQGFHKPSFTQTTWYGAASGGGEQLWRDGW